MCTLRDGTKRSLGHFEGVGGNARWSKVLRRHAIAQELDDMLPQGHRLLEDQQPLVHPVAVGAGLQARVAFGPVALRPAVTTTAAPGLSITAPSAMDAQQAQKVDGPLLSDE